MVRAHRLTSLLLLISVLAPAWVAARELARPPLEAKLATVGDLAATDAVPPRPTHTGRHLGGFFLEFDGTDGPGHPPLAAAHVEAHPATGGWRADRAPGPASCRPLCEHLPYYATAPPAGR